MEVDDDFGIKKKNSSSATASGVKMDLSGKRSAAMNNPESVDDNADGNAQMEDANANQ